MSALDPLATLDAWKSVSDPERSAILAALAQACGAAWRAGEVRVGRHGLGQLVHGDQRFVVVPGGWMRMGFSVDDVFLGANLREKREDTSPWSNIEGARPTRWVRIRPFLLAVDGIPAGFGEAASDGGAASIAYREAVKAAKGEIADEDDDQSDDDDESSDDGDRGPRLVQLDELPDVIAAIPAGFRLPTEAELEWVFREGGTTRWFGIDGDVAIEAETRNEILLGDLENGFGITSFRDIQTPCADGAGWYGGETPADQRALNTGAEQRIGRWAHTMWQWDDGEMMGMHAAARAALDEFGDTIVRLAADLPLGDAEPASPPGPLAEHALTLAALAGDDPLGRADALCALGHLARGPGHDAADTVAAVIEALPKLAPPLRARMLCWLADVQVGGHGAETTQKPERQRPEWLPDRASSRAVVAASVPLLATYLDDADPDVRSAAALALAFSPAAKDAAAPLLTARFQREDVVGVRAGIVLALARLGGVIPAGATVDPALVAAVAIGTAYDGEPDLDALVDATMLDQIPHLAYGHGELGDIAVGVLRRIGTPNARLRATTHIAARAARTANAGLAGAALEVAFGEDRLAGAPWAADQLSAEQRLVIERLVDVAGDLPWHAHGLPPTPSGRRRLLGLSPPGPSDRVIDHAGERRTLAYALRDLQVHEAPRDYQDGAPPRVTDMLAALDPATRLALFLDRQTHGLTTGVRRSDGSWAYEPIRDWKLVDLLEALGDDRIAARTEVDAIVAATDRPRGGTDLVAAVVATRAPSEALDPALLVELGDDMLGGDPALLARFPRADVEARLFGAVRPKIAAALASDSWSIGADTTVERLAPVLAVAPSPQVVRWMLLLGWASGQPASVREVIGEHAGAFPEVAAVLAEYDAYPAFTSWPRARAGLADLLGERP